MPVKEQKRDKTEKEKKKINENVRKPTEILKNFRIFFDLTTEQTQLFCKIFRL